MLLRLLRVTRRRIPMGRRLISVVRIVLPWVIVVAISIFIVLFHVFSNSTSYGMYRWSFVKYNYRLPLSPVKYSDPIKMAIVSCSGGNLEENVTEAKSTLEVLTLIKSVLISAYVYGGTEDVHFYIFTDTDALEMVLKSKLDEYNATVNSFIKMSVSYYNVAKAIPPNHLHRLDSLILKTRLPCTYFRIFFPEVLLTVHEIIYVDTDTIITGNIGEIWETFGDMRKNIQLAALSPNNEPEDTHFRYNDKVQFGETPHVPPKGVNAGVMFMNLAEMRKLNWTSKILQIYDQFTTGPTRVYMNDQRLVNIYFHDHPHKLKILPCNYNFMHLHCDYGLTCRNAKEDPKGIQIIHGAGSKFENHYPNNSAFRRIYEAFKNFDLGERDKIIDGLVKPLKLFYTVNFEFRCNEEMGPLIFRNLFDTIVTGV